MIFNSEVGQCHFNGPTSNHKSHPIPLTPSDYHTVTEILKEIPKRKETKDVVSLSRKRRISPFGFGPIDPKRQLGQYEIERDP